MSDRDPGSGDWPPDDWSEEPGSSVFGPRRPRPAPRPGYDQGPGPYAGGQRGYRDPWPHDGGQPGTAADGYDDPGPTTAASGGTATRGRRRRTAVPAAGLRLRPPTRGVASRPRPRSTRPGSAAARPGRRAGRRPGSRTPATTGRAAASRSGLGALLGVAGLACFLAALLVLPWFEVAGQGVTLADIRSSFTIAETDPDDLGLDTGTPTTLPEGIPTPEEISEAVEAEVRDQAAEAAADAIDTGRARYLKLYTRTLWLPVAIGVTLAVLFSTILAPKSAALSLLLGLRRLAGLVVILAAAAHGAALWVVFAGDGGPSPSMGVWLGIGGLAAVFAGCVVGPKD